MMMIPHDYNILYYTNCAVPFKMSTLSKRQKSQLTIICIEFVVVGQSTRRFLLKTYSLSLCMIFVTCCCLDASTFNEWLEHPT